MNKEILLKVDEIIKTIENSDLYQKYIRLKKQMSDNKDLLKLINEIKVLQKDVIHKMDKKQKLDDKLNKLNDYPIYREYNNTLSELNNTYAIIEKSINNYFYNKLN